MKIEGYLQLDKSYTYQKSVNQNFLINGAREF